MALQNNSIEHLTSAVIDGGRRGNPRPGCDCVQCFGYCLIDNDEAMRERFKALESKEAPSDIGLD